MGAFSRFSCFRGHKIRRPESLEPVCQIPVQAQDEKTVSLPRNVSDQQEIVDWDHAKVAGAEPQPEPQEAVTVRMLEPSPLADSNVECPSLPAIETTPTKDLFTELKAEEPPLNSSESKVSTSRPAPTVSQPVRAASPASSHSEPSSRGSSLQRTSTKATTPPQTPAETEPKSAPFATTLSQEREDAELTTDDPSPEAADAERDPTARAPSPHPQATDTKTLEAFPLTTPPPPSADSKPILDLKTIPFISGTTLLHRRPSYEDDTPITPQEHEFPPAPTTATTTAAAATTAAARTPMSRVSTAFAPFSRSLSLTRRNTKPKPEKEQRKSGLSRFLSTRQSKHVHVRDGFGIGVGGSGSGRNFKQVGLPELMEVEEEVVKEKERERQSSSTGWEKEIEKQVMSRIEGRKWREGGDNESVFCL